MSDTIKTLTVFVDNISEEQASLLCQAITQLRHVDEVHFGQVEDLATMSARVRERMIIRDKLYGLIRDWDE